MIHGHVTQGLLISTLIPIVKDPLASINISKNYRRVVENDTRTVTSRNLRSMLLLTDRPYIQHLSPSDMDAVCLYGEPELWRVLAINDILEMRAGELQLPDGWSLDEMEVILQAACCE